MEEKDNLVPELEGVDLEIRPDVEQDEATLDLDEILKEFSGQTEESAAEKPEQLEQESGMEEDTLRFDAVSEEDLETTVAFAPVQSSMEETRICRTRILWSLNRWKSLLSR